MDLEERLALVNKPPIEEIFHFDIVNKPPIDELYHYGILGMKWGIRRYQNEDGTLTPLGRDRAAKRMSKIEKRTEKRINKAINKERKRAERVEVTKKNYAKDPEQLRRHMDMFSNEEIQNAMQRIEWDNKLADMRNSKIEKGKRKADNILSYGDSLNAALNFINSPVGRGIRGAVGLPTNKIFDFASKDSINQEIAKKQALREAGFDTKNKAPEEYTADELEELLKKKRGNK